MERLKKILCLLLVLMTVFFVSCSRAEKKEETDENFASYLERADSFENVIHEYGEEAGRVLLGEKLSATVLYPETSIQELDIVIEKWINNLVSDYQLEAGGNDFEGAAELTVTYNCYESKYGIVSVEFIGIYSSSYLAHPIDIVKTFAAEIETEKLLDIDDILSQGKREDIENRLTEEFEIEREFTPEDLMEYWSISDDGLKIIFPRGEFLPMSDGTKSFTFSKKETDDMIKNEEADKEKEPEKEHETTATETEEKKTDIDNEKPMLALTFDDGPSAHTVRLLDIFEKYGGKGTFFVIGNTLDNRKDTLKRIAAEGHEIGNHSWSHRQFTNISLEEVKDQIMMTRAKIYDITGVDYTLVRPPYGACNDEIRALGKTLDVSFVNWSVDTLDWKTKNSDAVYKEIMKDACDGAIILCHDLHKTTVDAMEKVIPDLIEKGYQLVTVTELLTADGNEISAGKMYYKQSET